jgi:hypothetical protein
MRSLKEVYDFERKKKVRQLSPGGLRRLINEEVDLLREQDEEKKEEKEATGKIGDAPRGDAVDNKTNVKDVDPIEIANQLLSGDDDSPIVVSSQGNWFAYDGAAGKKWIEDLGPELFVTRLTALAGKVPKSGLPKSMMPFLPGPEDAKGSYSDVEDALTPGGDYNIDINPPFKEVANARGRALQFLMEKEEKEEEKEDDTGGGAKGKPPTANTFLGMDAPGAEEYMTAGLESEDGDADDDAITITKGGSVAADKAIPTQSNILIYKSMGFAVDGMAGGPLDAWAGTGGEILDGHHRWAATMLNDPSADMGTAGQVDLDALADPQDTLKHLTAIGNALGNETKIPGKEDKKESRNRSDNLVMERWRRLAGIL